MTTVNPQEILSQLRQIDLADLESDVQRTVLTDALRTTLARLETPWETAFRIICTQPAQAACLKVCQDVRLFSRWVETFSDAPVGEEEICALVDGDADVFARILRHLAATHIIEQTQQRTYRLTKFSQALGSSDMASIVSFLYNTTLPGFLNLPDFLRSTNYRNSSRGDDDDFTNWHHMRGVSRFDELKRNPADMECFQAVMKLNAMSKRPLTDFVPLEVLLSTHQTGSHLLVDVGGGVGYDLLQFHRSLSQKQDLLRAGSLVLQDLRSAVQNSDIESGGDCVVKMEHDFFDEQPIKGATAYYLHTVLHDWSDRDAVRILARLAAAAEPGYSRILIHEVVLVGDRPSVLTTSQDMQMMMALGSKERTEAEWGRVIAGAGLVVHKVWSRPGQVESVIEARKS